MGLKHLLTILIPFIFVVFLLDKARAEERLLQSHNLLYQYINQNNEVEGVKFDKRKLNKFYEQFQYQSVWIEKYQKNIRKFHNILLEADEEGLQKKIYNVDIIESLFVKTDDENRIKLEIILTQTFFNYIQDLKDGQIDPKTLNINWDIKKTPIDVIKTLNNVLEAYDFTAAVKKLAPQHYSYKYLKQALNIYRAEALKEVNRPKIPNGPLIKPGQKDSRIPLLRSRLSMDDIGIIIEEEGGSTIYTYALQVGIEQFQMDNNLNPDGIIGSQTLRVLNATVGDKVDKIILSMERLRWLPEDLGYRHIIATIPAFHLDVFEGDRLLMDMKTIVGRKSRETPSMRSEITNIVFNPPWNVPSRIASVDILPKLQEDPTYLAQHGYSLHDESGRVSIQNISLDAEEGYFPYRIRQRPGSGNALGRIKFNMPNRHTVYLHDTSQRHLFEKESRALSSGCVRVSMPNELAEYIMNYEAGWTIVDVEDIINKEKTDSKNIIDPVQVFLLYATTRVDENGAVYFYDDIYGHDEKLKAELL